MPKDLEGRWVLIAGASSGMGRAIAIKAAEQGADLILLGRDAVRLDATAAATGDGTIAIVADASDPASLQEALAPLEQRGIAIDVLVNAVGMNISARSFDKLTDESFAAMIDHNLWAAFNLTKAILPSMRSRRQGLVIHIASTAARKADLSGAAYQAAKAGVVALNHAIMEEAWQDGIRMTALMPGMTNTPLLDRRPTLTSAEARAAALQPIDIAETCLFVMKLPPRAHIAEIVMLPAERV